MFVVSSENAELIKQTLMEVKHYVKLSLDFLTGFKDYMDLLEEFSLLSDWQWSSPKNKCLTS